ncbi:hypothetical protein F4604DRAFT_1877964 [Suillus subluteus]|nr:hypothetical protein F4604DRAFT_1877964 [Suillus subluteus]
MASNEDRLRTKVANLNASLDDLEIQLEPLFTKSLPETSRQIASRFYHMYYTILYSVYLKTRGIDPRTHPVIGELDRVRQYFDKIKKRRRFRREKLGIDKAAAGRFIKHAIAQAKLVKVGEPNNTAHGPASTSSERVPVKITSKMAERAEYEKNLEEIGSEEEEEDLEVFDEAEMSGDEDAMEEEALPPQDKGKSRMVEREVPETEEQVGGRRKRPRMDPFAASGYGDDDDNSSKSEKAKKPKKKSPASVLPRADSVSAAHTPDQSRQSTPLSAADEAQQRKAGKKERRKEKKSSS